MLVAQTSVFDVSFVVNHRLKSVPLLGRIPEDGEKVTGSPRDDEEVPGEMSITHAVRRVETNASGVSDTAREYPG